MYIFFGYLVNKLEIWWVYLFPIDLLHYRDNYLILLIKKIIHNISSNIHIILEKRLIKFIHSALNAKEMCKQILYVKLRCKKSSFAENYRYLHCQYNLSDCD